MKKLLLFAFILLGFIAKSQELDEIYIRETIYLADSGVNKITGGDTLATKEYVDANGGGGTPAGSTGEMQFNTAGSFDASANLTFLGDSLNVSGNIIGDTIKANGIGIGVSHPLSALHINKGVGSLANGISFGNGTDNGFYPITTNEISVRIGGFDWWKFSGADFRGATNGAELSGSTPSATGVTVRPNAVDNNTGLGWAGADDLSIIAGSKEIARATEAVTEQFIINPQGDLTGTLAAPNLAFTNSDLTTDVGLFLVSDNTLAVTVNSIEAMRLTEDTVFVDSTIAPLQIKFPDGTIQTTAATGDFTGVIQVAKAQVLYTNTSQTTIITLPADAVIWNIGINITTLFDGSGTDFFDIGITGTVNRYVDDYPAQFTGFNQYLDNGISANNLPDEMSGSTNITFQYIDQNSDATQGEAYVYIHYTLH